jgi:arginyl-tRNA synthetase
VKNLIESLLQQAVDALPETSLPASARSGGFEVEHARDPAHGDFASNVALRLA